MFSFLFENKQKQSWKPFYLKTTQNNAFIYQQSLENNHNILKKTIKPKYKKILFAIEEPFLSTNDDYTIPKKSVDLLPCYYNTSKTEKQTSLFLLYTIPLGFFFLSYYFKKV
jgi:hypothetical protein